jgi:hypothetical protein
VDFSDRVPFGLGLAYANAGMQVLTTETTSSGSNWSDINKSFEDENIDVLLIRNYMTGWSAGDYNQGHIRRVDVRIWDIPVLGESYFGSSSFFGQPTKIFGQSMLNYLNDRPYVDHNPDANQYSDMLDPVAVVEDKDDDGVKDKKEDLNKNGTLDGDQVQSEVSTWDNPAKLNPFNINNNENVELPQQSGDPNAVSAADEYSVSVVSRHVIGHEIGHALGMGVGDPGFVDNLGHCFDQGCMMYQYSIDWQRDGYLCPYHQGMIQAHNH